MRPLSIRARTSGRAAARRTGLGSALALALIAAGATAGEEPGQRKAATEPRTGCPRGERSALTEVACELARSLGKVGVPVVGAALPRGDRGLLRGEELASRLAAAVAGAFGKGARSVPGVSTLAAVRASTAPGEGSVFLVTEIVGGELRVTASASVAGLGFWDRVRGAALPGGIQAHATRRLDGEIASFLPRLPEGAPHADRIGPLPDAVLALACGDLDVDPGLEVALVSRLRIQLGTLRDNRLRPTAEVLWAKVVPIAPTPLREPLARAEIWPGLELAVGVTDRAHAWVFSGALAPVRQLALVIPFGPGSCYSRVKTALGAHARCDASGIPASPAIAMPGDLSITDTVASGTSVNAAGVARRVAAFRAPGDGSVALLDDAGHVARAPSAGGALAVTDLDLDGVPELVSSENTANPADDAIVVRSFREDGSLPELLRIPMPEGVRAVAACPPEGARRPALLVATGSSLWVIR